jgi:phage terminase large subunit-like protein
MSFEAKTVDPEWIRNPSDILAIEQGCYFDEAMGLRAIRFIETFCKQSKGRWAGQALTLLDWQKDFLMRLFGWRRADGRRRFRRFYLEVAKKNGKSTLISSLALLLLLADVWRDQAGTLKADGAPEVYLNAVDRDQASIVFDEATRMIRKSPELARRLNIVNHVKRIIDPNGGGKIQANSADVASKDGVNASAVFFDELHRQKNRELWDIFEYAGASREQPLTGSITTAGESADGVWHEQREYSDGVNAGTIPDWTHLGVVYRALEGDDIDDPATWLKANPSLGVTISEEDFRRELEEAKQVPTKLANFKRLRLCIVARGDQQFVALEAWDRCGSSIIVRAGDPWWGGLDLSQTQDLSAFAKLAGGPESFDLSVKFWLPEQNIEELERQHQLPYRTWADKGLIVLTPGNVIDYSFIRSEINEQAGDGHCRRILVDPYNATKIGLELRDQDGLPIDFIRQGFLSLSAPTKEFLRLVLGGRIRHGGNPILRNHISNAVAEQDAAGNIKLSKRKSKKKIDGAAATVNAVAATSLDVGEGESVYDSRGVLFI